MTALTKKEIQARAEANIKDTMDSLPADAIALYDAGLVFSGKASGKKIQGFAKAGPMVPPIDPDFVLQGPSAQAVVLWLLDCDQGGRDGLFLTGPTGAGKSSLLRNLCSRLNLPLYQATGHSRLDVSDLIGHLTLTEGSNGNSVMAYTYGPLALAMRDGGCFLLDEADAADPSVLILLNGILDGGDLLIPENGGEVIKRHKMFRIAFTGNGVGGDEAGLYTGVNRMNFAFMDRLVTVRCSYPAEDVEMGILKRRVPGLPEAVCKTCLQYANTVRSSFESGEIGCTFSTRTVVRWASWATKLLPLAKSNPEARPLFLALDLALGNRTDRPTRAALSEILQRVVGDGVAPAVEAKKGKGKTSKVS